MLTKNHYFSFSFICIFNMCHLATYLTIRLYFEYRVINMFYKNLINIFIDSFLRLTNFFQI